MGVLVMVLEVEVVELTLLLDGVDVFDDEGVISTRHKLFILSSK